MTDTLASLRAEVDALKTALHLIHSGYGPQHLSKYARDVARAALTSSSPVGEQVMVPRELFDSVCARFERALSPAMLGPKNGKHWEFLIQSEAVLSELRALLPAPPDRQENSDG